MLGPEPCIPGNPLAEWGIRMSAELLERADYLSALNANWHPCSRVRVDAWCSSAARQALVSRPWFSASAAAARASLLALACRRRHVHGRCGRALYTRDERSLGGSRATVGGPRVPVRGRSAPARAGAEAVRVAYQRGLVPNVATLPTRNIGGDAPNMGVFLHRHRRAPSCVARQTIHAAVSHIRRVPPRAGQD
jgi:hypothetical protein